MELATVLAILWTLMLGIWILRCIVTGVTDNECTEVYLTPDIPGSITAMSAVKSGTTPCHGSVF